MNDVRNAVAPFGTISNEVRTYSQNGVTLNLSATNDNQVITMNDNNGDVIINYSFTVTDADGCMYDYSTTFVIGESNVIDGEGWQAFETVPIICSPI